MSNSAFIIRHLVRSSVLSVCICIALPFVLSASPVRAQGILEQLEKKVRDGLELSPTADPPSTNPPSTNPSTANPSTAKPSDSELPPPTASGKKVPPPLPRPDVSGGMKNTIPKPSSSSILEAPLLPANNPPTPDNPAEGGIYLGLEAESLTGGGIGARIVSVTNNSPAWRAGFKTSDIILAIDGFAIANLDTMVERLSMRRPGDTIKVLVLRNNRNVELAAVLQNAAVAQRIHGINPNSPIPSPLTPAGNAWLGVVVSDLSSAFRTQFGLRAFRAAAVTNVTRGSPADTLSIQPGDAIIGVDGQPIESARELLDWMATKRPGDLVSLNVMRGSRSTIMETTLVTDPKSLPNVTTARPPLPDPFAPSALNALNAPGTLNAPSAMELNASENTVPQPGLSETSQVQQLRGELKAAQDQIQSLEQRIAELESLIKRK